MFPGRRTFSRKQGSVINLDTEDRNIVKQEREITPRREDRPKASTVMALAEAVNRRGDIAKRTMGRAVEATCALESVKEAISQETQLVVDISESAKRAYDEGLIKFDTNKAGEMFAQLKGADGRYGKKIPIKEQVVSQGLDPLEVQNALRTRAIQEQLEQIVVTLQEIGESVGEIKQGQHNDRLGLFVSGQTLYLESCEISDPSLKKLLQAQALKSLSDANGQLTQSISADIKYLAEGRYKSRKTGQKAAIEEKLTSIRSALETVNMSFALKAAIYYSAGETGAMLQCLGQYSEFIGEHIVPNSKKLAELDPKEQLPKGGFWAEKAKALEGVECIRGLLTESESDIEALGLEASEEKDNGEG